MIAINRIKPKHLDLVVQIAETQKLHLAAQNVGMSQPAASRILHDLEGQFGIALFDRHPTGMELTPGGHVFVRHARSVLAELNTLSVELNHLQSGQMGSVRVGAVTGPAVGHLMPAVHALRERAPDVRISVDVAPSTVLFRGLEEARYDFILGRADPRRNPNDFRFHPGRKEMIRLMVLDSHPLAGRAEVPLSDLTSYPWVMQEEGSPIRVAVEDGFHGQGLPIPASILNSSSLLVALAQVAMGRAIAPQTEEVVRLLTSAQLGLNVTTLTTKTGFEVAPYFVIQDERRKLSRAASELLQGVMAGF